MAVRIALQPPQMKKEGFDKSTVSKTVRDVTDALVAKAEHFIWWPISSNVRTTIKTGFYAPARFPNVIGCIDGTHVRILAPSEDENAYVNRKGFHSINVQAICDHDDLLRHRTSGFANSSIGPPHSSPCTPSKQGLLKTDYPDSDETMFALLQGAIVDGTVIGGDSAIGDGTVIGGDSANGDGHVIGGDSAIGDGANGDGHVIGGDSANGDGHVIGGDSAIGDGYVIGGGSAIGDGAIGDGNVIGGGSAIGDYVIGGDSAIGDGNVIGGDSGIGNGYIFAGDSFIGDGNVIGGDSAIGDGNVIGGGSAIGDGYVIGGDIAIGDGNVN
uniref:Uncharacterized protein LOC111137719 n=1 Tax=Crassostrea virginica TaxID=6565 RepID=A0A8B8EYC4_CRAVI|nr:uncharacterized protein LOC111137719 [Crassostrea virginica]